MTIIYLVHKTRTHTILNSDLYSQTLLFVHLRSPIYTKKKRLLSSLMHPWYYINDPLYSRSKKNRIKWFDTRQTSGVENFSFFFSGFVNKIWDRRDKLSSVSYIMNRQASPAFLYPFVWMVFFYIVFRINIVYIVMPPVPVAYYILYRYYYNAIAVFRESAKDKTIFHDADDWLKDTNVRSIIYIYGIWYL